MDFTERIARFAEQERLFRRVSKIVVAVSGGPDSVAALLALLDLRERFGFEVVAGHFDHKLRPDSAADLQFVKDLCTGLDIRCVTGEGDVAEAAAAQGLSVEDAARRARYEFMAFAAGKEQCEAVVTGHTASDQAETVLLNILRGSGIRGLRGMLPASTVPGAGAIALVRPLLCVTREETVAFCAERAAATLTDPSNEDTAFKRNQLRLETMPALREVNPSASDALIRLAASARELFADVEARANQAQPAARGPEGATFDLETLSALPTEAIGLILDREASFTRTAVETNATRLANLRDVLDSGDGEVEFGETVVEASSGRVRVGARLEPPAQFEPTIVNIPGVTMAGPWRIEVSTDPMPIEPGARVIEVEMDYEGLLRAAPLTGDDRLDRNGEPRRLSRVLQDEKVPRWERAYTLALVAKGQVIALVGAADRLSPTVEGDDRLYVRVRRTD